MTFEESLAGFDRDIARADRTWRRWQTRLRTGEAAALREDPLVPLHHVAGKNAYTTLQAMSPIASDVPWRDALLRWVLELTQRRVARDSLVDWQEKADAPEARQALAPLHPISYRQAWDGARQERTPPKVEAYLDAAAQIGPKLASITREAGQRRAEVASRLGLQGPLALTTKMTDGALQTLAVGLLTATTDLWGAVCKEARKDGEGGTAAEGLIKAFVVDAPEGWPARLTGRWLDELLGGFARGLKLEVRVPEALGGASFSRALASFGYGLRVAGPSPALPFGLARDPHPIDAYRFGLVFGALPASPTFQRRALGNVQRVAEAQARAFRKEALREARAIAVRALLTDGAERVRADRFGDLTGQMFGGPLPAGLAGAWPHARGDEATRLVALLTAMPLLDELVDRFDLDWFNNPRAVSFLRARASAPAMADVDREPVAILATTALAKRFEQELG